MKKLKEVLVVEGRYDKNTLSQVVDATIIPVNGFSVFHDKELLSLLRRQEPSPKLMTSNSLNSENEIICRAQQFISANIREKLTVPLVAKKVDVIGFDLNAAKIDLYKQGIDPTNEVGSEGLAGCTVDFTADAGRLKEAKFIIVAGKT